MDLALYNLHWLICHKTKPNQRRCSSEKFRRLRRFTLLFLNSQWGARAAENSGKIGSKTHSPVLETNIVKHQNELEPDWTELSRPSTFYDVRAFWICSAQKNKSCVQSRSRDMETNIYFTLLTLFLSLAQSQFNSFHSHSLRHWTMYSFWQQPTWENLQL